MSFFQIGNISINRSIVSIYIMPLFFIFFAFFQFSLAVSHFISVLFVPLNRCIFSACDMYYFYNKTTSNCATVMQCVRATFDEVLQLVQPFSLFFPSVCWVSKTAAAVATTKNVYVMHSLASFYSPLQFMCISFIYIYIYSITILCQ